MSTTLTFTARLRDQLSGPSLKATKAVEQLGMATDKAALAAGRYSQAQDRARAANGRFISASDRARRSTQGQIGTTRTLGSTWENTGRKLIGGATGAWRAASAVDRLTQRLGISEAMGNRFGIRVAQTLLRLPGQAGAAATGFGGAMTRLSGYATTASQKIHDAMSRAGKAVGLAGAAVAGMAIYGGVNRLTSLESADVKLETMGYNEGQRDSIMGTVDQVVSGTPFALNEAMTGAAQYLAAGVTPEDLQSRLQTTVDMAGIYDMNLGDASLIMSKVLATGTLQGDEVMQLQERGMPVYRALADSLGVDQSEVKGLISEGKVTAEEFFKAIAPTVEGGAEKLGNTWKGRFANLRTALSRSAALALEPLMDPTKDLFTGLTDMLRDAAPFFTSVGENLAPGIALAAEKAPEIGRALAPLGPPLLALFGAVGDALPHLIDGFAMWARILAPVAGFLARAAGFVLDLTAPALPWLVPLVLGLGALSTTMFGVTVAVLGFKVFRFVTPLMFGVMRSVLGSARAMGFLRGAARLAGGALRFMFPMLSMVTRGLFLLGRALMLTPLGRVITLLFVAAAAFKWLYDNVKPVREAVDGLVGFLDKMDEKLKNIGTRIENLVREKFPQLNSAMDGMQEGVSRFDNGGFQSAVDNTSIGENPVASWIWGKVSGMWSAEDVPHHAEGGWTASGAHLAVVGEEGPEFVVPSWASKKLASVPGALGAISAGRVPVTPVPAPVGASGGATVYNVGDVHLHVAPGTDGADFARRFHAELAKVARVQRLTTSTLTERGAR